jgi:hypothetical protein
MKKVLVYALAFVFVAGIAATSVVAQDKPKEEAKKEAPAKKEAKAEKKEAKAEKKEAKAEKKEAPKAEAKKDTTKKK